MKLTELILELHTIMLEKGNLDVEVEKFDSDEAPYYEPPKLLVTEPPGSVVLFYY